MWYKKELTLFIKNLNECFSKKHQAENVINTQWFCVILSEKTAYFITVLSKIFMQICNLFFYHDISGVVWIFVKGLKRTTITVIMFNCHI